MKGLFYFGRHDRDALVLLVIVAIACVVLFPFLASDNPQDATPAYVKDASHGDTHRNNRYNGRAGHYAQANGAYGDGSVAVSPASRQRLTPFPFDPNTADSTQLLRLGLLPWQVRSIYKYRANGGYFSRPADFARLRWLTAQQYRQLEPYIRINREPMAADVVKGRERKDRVADVPIRQTSAPLGVPAYDKPRKLSYGETVDINTVDTTALKTIPGIGSYFARRIVELRQRRGAFASPEDLLAIRNFPETALAYMTVSETFPAIHINSATQRELNAHPLLNYTQASDIVTLRRLNGTFHSARDLSLVPSIPASLLARLAPFLVFD